VQSWIVHYVGWFYSFAVAVFVVFVLYLAMSRFGHTKLGPDDSEPEFSFATWFAMLFSAGMGIGLMFYGVAEPVLHYASPPIGEGSTVESAREALSITLFHWGLHAWAIYIVVGLSIAYFSFRHGLPLTIRSALYPIIGKHYDGPIGHAVDVLAVFGTMFGVATSLGLGVMQVNAGLNFLFGTPINLSVQFILIAAITAAATASVVSGLGRGIRRLSELNILLALALLVYMFVAGPTAFLFQAVMQNAGNYLGSIVTRTFNLYAYQPNDWVGGWTLFYWGWWISWAPFVGMFIARVSRGRTVREFVFGVLAVPTIVTCLWFTAFGNTAIEIDMATGGAIASAVGDNVATALFVFFEQMPLSSAVSLVATVLVVTFFVTSSDSGSLVIDMITSGGRANPPLWTRIFWALAEGVVAAILLAAGGLVALQTAAIASGFPFAIIMLFVCFGLMRGLQIEAGAAERRRVSSAAVASVGVPWRKRLKNILSFPNRREADKFVAETLTPALQSVASEIQEAAGFETSVETAKDAVALSVSHGEESDFVYRVELHNYRRPTFAYPEVSFEEDGENYWRAEVSLLEGPQHYDILEFTEEQVIADVLAQYDLHMSFLHHAAPPQNT
jgi:choline/glycine/proline betaine transport protein